MGEAIGGLVEGVIGIVGTAISAMEAHEVALENVDYYRAGAVDEQVAALDREQTRRQEIRAKLGQQVTNLAKSGVTISGSPILALGELLRRGEEDLAAVRREGDLAVREQLRQAETQLRLARTIRRTGNAQQAGGAFQAVGAGASRLSSMRRNTGNNDQPSTFRENGNTFSSQSDADFFADQNQLFWEDA